jgi:uncharacterized protein (DUF2249 family)
MSKKKAVTLDVREDIQRGREPFSRIMQAVASLGVGDDLVIIAPFEPTPLYAVLAQRGFSYQAQATESGDWQICFSHKTQEQDEARAPSRSHRPSEVSQIEVDTRGLEPPQPLVQILEAVATFPDGACIVALTDRRPMHLYAHLEERGLLGETKEAVDGSFITYVRRK